MDTVHRELEGLIGELTPSFIDLELLERLVIEDDVLAFDGECTIHDGCRAVGF